ncbi:aminotransferase class III-fold pyridoxal phosphate-dependent enzyme [Pseudonocardia sp. DSM 110487]|uniref:aminotransferase class III-fold pyridoxal phosphate-dependent enzyme n=1 Tax=Pseudonocardia sp. DSM 110487 TaxID=2865833 RepID=UPI001C6987D8|nr:aminotransferase class III-fold pyridoxal phosphate-dependent enzyme [Pseudonocardia sp. DSM 110487]QYN33733.1 aminotransferase class III-fold pyridoxal phosphate-dependent enzyme [Pseudonocardia sp. DSM 110487]
MQTGRPRQTTTGAAALLGELFGVAADDARDLGSERDQAFLVLSAGRPVAVLKVSNPAEDPEVLDMEAAAALHVHHIDPALGVARPWPVPGTPDAFRARWNDGGDVYWVRAYDVLPGTGRVDPTTLDDRALRIWGSTSARLGRALRGFSHPKAHRTMLWDVQHAARARDLLGYIPDDERRAAVERVVDRFDEVVVPAWPRLRAQVVHGDLTVDNALTAADGTITGIVDFGDMSHATLLTDLASLLESLVCGRSGEEMFRAARLVIDGYERVTPLEPEEVDLLGEVWAARAALNIAISEWRVAQGLEDPVFARRYNDPAAATIAGFEAVGWDGVRRQLGGSRVEAPTARLVQRRDAVFGPAAEPLFYREPVHVASAEGVWITDVTGRRYLDGYNNVPCVGHAHPRVTAAISRQARLINTHTRYLSEPAVELAERLAASCPPGLDTVLLVNSGSEANDLAWRLARAATGRDGALCTDFAYHGLTEAVAAVSPEVWLDGRSPDHVATWTPPDPYRGTALGEESFEAALERLRVSGHEPAAVYLDTLLTSEGIVDLDPAYVRALHRRAKAAGALWVADEVQSGHGRTGEALWAFSRFGIEPDVVTLGKPMGNGHPVAAVIARSEVVQAAAGRTVLFSTFGGNPVSAAAALAVLDVIDDERVLDRVRHTGETLRAALREVAGRHPAIGDVRGVGLAVGVEIVRPGGTEPDRATAVAVRDGMRDRGVLVGTTGRAGNVLKIRPPLAFTRTEVPVLVDALDRTLAEQPGP